MDALYLFSFWGGFISMTPRGGFNAFTTRFFVHIFVTTNCNILARFFLFHFPFSFLFVGQLCMIHSMVWFAIAVVCFDGSLLQPSNLVLAIAILLINGRRAYINAHGYVARSNLRMAAWYEMGWIVVGRLARDPQGQGRHFACRLVHIRAVRRFAGCQP